MWRLAVPPARLPLERTHMPKIFEDTRQQVAHSDKHVTKHRWWAAHGVEVERVKLDAGD